MLSLFPPAAAHHGWSQLAWLGAEGGHFAIMINDVMTLDPGPWTKFQVLTCRCVKLDQFYRFPPIHDIPAELSGMLSSVCGKV